GQDNAHIISYSAGPDARNLTLAQSTSNYLAYQRIGEATDANGEPVLATDDDPLQASLQHVALTFDPINGRQLYINGERNEAMDPATPGLLSTWDDTFALVLGNEASSDRPWEGVIRFAAIHNRALNAEQIQTNFAAGVGERYFLPFYIGHLIDQPGAYLVFEVSRFDNYSYLFAAPYFINLQQDIVEDEAPLEGLRIGINGRVPGVAQSFATLDTLIGGDGYSEQGENLSRLGTLLPVEQGQDNDEFFLTFERLGQHTNVYTEPAPLPLMPNTYGEQPSIGLRDFAEVNATMSQLTGVPQGHGEVPDTYQRLRTQLPTEENIEAFLTAHQIGVAQLAIEYCNALVEAERNGDSSIPALFVGMNYNARVETITQQQWRDRVISPLFDRMVGLDLNHQPSRNAVEGELEDLLFTTNLTQCSGDDATCQERTATATKAACAAMLGSATMLVQ
ncbi:MAG: LamG domain-containing protein, partial [Pseudomonadota bacterium]|nr:LamG domain-containing protein [Pseudomonadota bacterium]